VYVGALINGSKPSCDVNHLIGTLTVPDEGPKLQLGKNAMSRVACCTRLGTLCRYVGINSIGTSIIQ